MVWYNVVVQVHLTILQRVILPLVEFAMEILVMME